ncbi:MAG: peptidase M75 [Comamonadaceae bacterium]|nr:peptidase M75 [Comamonadaceae bacterium]
MNTPHPLKRRALLAALAAGAMLPCATGWAQSSSPVAFPFYSGEQALQGLYGQHLPPLAKAFDIEAQALLVAARQHCDGLITLPPLKHAWRNALLAWVTLSTPALGPVIERRSQRQIDFWPPRPALLEKALKSAPMSLADMERVGAPAKGFPTLERLLVGPPNPAHCPYLVLIAEATAAEATALRVGFDALGARDWSTDEAAARSAFAEWINQWLGGLERLRWMHIEQPVQKARTAGKGHRPEFARLATAHNQAEWRAQWQALRAQARLTPGQTAQALQPGEGLIPIEALLLGKGHLALAQRWAAALDAADAAMKRLPARALDKDLMALSRTLKDVTTLYQAEVAAALDVPLGFSDADGD